MWPWLVETYKKKPTLCRVLFYPSHVEMLKLVSHVLSDLGWINYSGQNTVWQFWASRVWSTIDAATATPLGKRRSVPCFLSWCSLLSHFNHTPSLKMHIPQQNSHKFQHYMLASTICELKMPKRIEHSTNQSQMSTIGKHNYHPDLKYPSEKKPDATGEENSIMCQGCASLCRFLFHHRMCR